MKPRLGPKASFVVSVVVALVGLFATWGTVDAQLSLNARGVTGTAQVVNVDQGASKRSGPTIDVRLVSSASDDTVTLDRFSGDPQPGDQIKVRYDPLDPSTMVQEGVGVWGAFQILMLFIGTAGAVCAVIEWQRMRRPRHPRRRRR